MHSKLAVVLAMILIAGCHASVGTDSTPLAPSRAPGELTTRSEADTVRDFGRELNDSRDRFDEADALTRLHRYLADRGLTFTVKRITARDRGPRESRETRIEVFHGQQPIQSISFVPRDEKNLALLGQ